MTQRNHWFAMLIVVGAWTEPALAAVDSKNRDAARELVNDGGSLFENGRFEEARNKFVAALELVQVPTAALWAARANEKLGRLTAAARLYQAALEMKTNELWVGPGQLRAQKNARDELDMLSSRIPTVKVEVVGGSAAEWEVTVDEVRFAPDARDAEVPLDPGEHRLVVTKDGRTLAQSVTLLEKEQKVITFDFAPAAEEVAPGLARPSAIGLLPAPVLSTAAPSPRIDTTPQKPTSSPRYPLTWASLGVGAAGLALGTTAGIVTWVKRSNLMEDGCSSKQCTEGTVDGARVTSYKTWRTLSTVGYIVGGVGAAVGITLLSVHPKHEGSPTLSFVVAPNALSIDAGF